MFSTSHLYVGALLDEKRAASAAERLAAQTPSTESKLGFTAAVKNAWSFMTGPAERPGTPTFVNYPFRG
jgi:hypothetical protein